MTFSDPSSIVQLDPAQILQAIDADCRLLDRAGKELGSVGRELEDAELAYEEAFELALAEMVEEHAETGKRLPGEEARRAVIHKQIGRELYETKRRLERRMDRIERVCRKVERALDGRRSELSFLKAEGTHGS